nr:hypothetical protein [Candidatus Sigynarchaeota archaeon]
MKSTIRRFKVGFLLFITVALVFCKCVSISMNKPGGCARPTVQGRINASVIRRAVMPSAVYNVGLIGAPFSGLIEISMDIINEYNGSAWFPIHNPTLALYRFDVPIGKVLLVGRPLSIGGYPDMIIGWVNRSVASASFDELNQIELLDPVTYHSIAVSWATTVTPGPDYLKIDPVIVYGIPANHATNITVILKPTANCQDSARIYFNSPQYPTRQPVIVEDLGPTLNLTSAQWEEVMVADWSGMLNFGVRDVDENLFRSTWCQDLLATYYAVGSFEHFMSNFDWSNGGSSGGVGGGTGGGGGSIGGILDSLKGQGGTILLVIGIVGVIYLMCKCRGKAPSKAAEGTAKRAPQPAQPSSGSDDTIKLLCLTMLSENVANHRDRVQNQIRMSRTNDPELEYKRKLLE